MRLREWICTLAIFAIAFGLLTLWSYPSIHPQALGELTVASGLRPPPDIFNGVYRWLVRLMFVSMPPSAALALIPWLGRLVIALSAAGVYTVFRDILPPVMRVNVHYGRIVATVSRGIAAMSAVLFVCIDPVWRAGQAFSPVTLYVGLVVAAAFCYFRFLCTGRLIALYAAFLTFGVVSSENAAGILFSACAAAYLAYAVHVDEVLERVSDEFVWSVTARRISYVWILSYVAALSSGVYFFVEGGGMEAIGCEGVFGLIQQHLRGSWTLLRSAAETGGWLLGVFACVMPFAVAVGMLRSAWREDSFLPYVVGAVFLLIALVALSQISGINPFWSGISSRQTTLVPSDALLATFLGFSLVTFALSMNVFGVDIFTRNYRMIAHWRFPDSVAEPGPRKFAWKLGRGRRWRKAVFWSMLFALPLVAIPSRRQSLERGMLALMDEFVAETVRECDGRCVVFSDGAFDCAYELAAMALGRRLVALSLLAPNTAYERAVRYRAVENDEDRHLLVNDSSAALRTWVEAGDSNRLARCAVQIGFEFWKRFGTPFPPFSGTAALPGAADEDEIGRGRTVADGIARGVLDLCAEEKPEETSDRELRRLFPFLQWRLSRMCRMRAYADAAAKRSADSIRAIEMAEMLDAVNGDLLALNVRNTWTDYQNGGALTPREGLVIGLARADFRLASYYAVPILKADPDDSRANFAMGMKHYLAEEYPMAERYFVRCLKKRPGEPAALNNLANTEAKLGKFAEAEGHARQALEKLPGSPEIEKTLSRIKELAAKAKQ